MGGRLPNEAPSMVPATVNAVQWTLFIAFSHTSIPGFILLRFSVLLGYCFFFFFNKLKVYAATLLWASLQCRFSNSTCSLRVSVSHVGNSCNIANLFIIVVFVMVICDQWSLMLLLQKITTCWRLRWWSAFFNNKVLFKLRYVYFFRHNAIAYLMDYSTV